MDTPATTLADRIADRAAEAGGRVAKECRLPGLSAWGRVRDWRLLQIGKMANVSLYLESDMTPEAIADVGADHILVATGRAPNVEGLGLDTAGIRFSRKGIEVDAGLRTTNRKVYAIGDVAGSLQFTHVAGYHAGLVIRSILFRQRIRPDTSIIPWVTFVDPEIAHVGMSEAEAAGKYRDLRILRWPYAENDRAQAERKTTGLIKVVADRKGRILGATIAGANAGEMIHVWALALTKKMKLSDMTGYVAPYPTMTEIGKRAAVTFYAPLARKPIIRSVIGLLRKFG